MKTNNNKRQRGKGKQEKKEGVKKEHKEGI